MAWKKVYPIKTEITEGEHENTKTLTLKNLHPYMLDQIIWLFNHGKFDNNEYDYVLEPERN